MKKIIAGIIFILLCIMLYFICFKGFSIGAMDITSIEGVKNISAELDLKNNEAKEITNKTYPSSLSKLKEAINSLNVAKDKYNEKTNNGEYTSINTIQIEKYKIEFLWTKIGNYAEENDIEMQMDVIQEENGLYDLEFNLVGTYINITDFIYDIEKDSDLNFQILDFKLLPNNTITTTTIKTEENSTSIVKNPFDYIISIIRKEAIRYGNEIENTNNKEIETETNENNSGNTEETNENNSGNTEETKTTYNPKSLKASFKVYGIEINFD